MIEFKWENLADLKRAFSPKVVEGAARATSNKVARQASVQVSRMAREKYSVAASEIAKSLKIKPHKSGKILLYTAGGRGLEKFKGGTKRVKSARGPRIAATAKVIKTKRKSVVGRPKGYHGKGFMANGRIYARKTKSRGSLRRLYGPSVPQMVGNEANMSKLDAFVADRYNIVFGQEMRFRTRIK